MSKKPLFDKDFAFRAITGVSDVSEKEESDPQAAETAAAEEVIPVNKKPKEVPVKKVNSDETPNSSDEFIVSKKKEEIRSKRVNLVIKPSVHKKAQQKCSKMGISINECINQFLEQWTVEG